MGSRYGGVKQIDGVGPHGEAIIDYSIYDALRVGFTDLCFVIRADIEEAVRGFFAGKFDDQVAVSYAVQSLEDVPNGVSSSVKREKPWGTAHAVYAARHAVKTPFAVVNADDFYGRDSYAQAYAFLRDLEETSSEYAMVGFRLDETLSDHGSVSRGICQTDANGYLTSVVEHKKIERIGNRITDLVEDGEPMELAPDDVASMNMFAFAPSVFGYLEEEFARFVKENGSDPKAEFYIPSLMTRLIETERATMKVLPTASRWFGMTYREDREAVQGQVRAFLESGEYPRQLWR